MRNYEFKASQLLSSVYIRSYSEIGVLPSE